MSTPRTDLETALAESLAEVEACEGALAVASARRDDVIRALVDQGVSDYRVAKLSGLSPPAVKTIATRPDRFLNAARGVMKRAGADPDDAGELGRWARRVRGLGLTAHETCRRGVLVARDGRLIAETMTATGDAGSPSASYVHALLVDDAPDSVVGIEVGLASGSLRRALDVDVMHVKAGSLCYQTLSAPRE